MKQYLIAIAMVLALSSNANATAQKHRHTPRTEQVSDTVKHDQGSIEAFSDTTAKADSNANDDEDYTYEHRVTLEGDEAAEHVVKSVMDNMGGAVFLVPILAILCFGFFLPSSNTDFGILLHQSQSKREVSPGSDGNTERTTDSRGIAEGDLFNK